MKKDALLSALNEFEISQNEMNDLKGGASDRPTLVSEEFWSDGLNTYRDSYWSDGSEVCSQFWGCDCGNTTGGGGTSTATEAAHTRTRG